MSLTSFSPPPIRAESLARAALGDGYVDAVLQTEDQDAASLQELLDEEQRLTMQYDELSATYTLLDNGKHWTMQEIESDASLGDDEYYRLYDAYNAGFNARAGRDLSRTAEHPRRDREHARLFGLRELLLHSLRAGLYARGRQTAAGRGQEVYRTRIYSRQRRGGHQRSCGRFVFRERLS